MSQFDINRTVEQMREHSQRLAERMRDLSEQASDDNSMVTVTCAPGGRLVDIQFDPRARRLDTHELRDAVLEAAGRAAEAAQRRLNDVMSSFSAELGLPGGDIGRELAGKMAEVQQVIKQEQERLAAALATDNQ